jgi:hypothetical protein
MPITDAQLDTLAAAVRAGAADGDVVADVAGRVARDDADAWLQEWTAAGGAAWAAARAEPSATRYLHAATYYATALARIADSDGSVDEAALRERRRECWERAVALLPRPAQRRDGTLFFPAGDDDGSTPRPLVVIDHGGRLSALHAWVRGGAAAHARGQHWLTFDGPAVDWAAAAARPDVDRARIALVGLEHAAVGVARALADEDRVAAAVLAPGITDASSPWLAALPDPVRSALLRGDRTAFERELHLASLFAPDTEARLRRHAAPYGGGPGVPLFEVYDRIRADRLDDEAIARIATPVLVCEGPGGARWPGQARALHDRLPGPRKELTTAVPGDDAVADWLVRTLGTASARA